MGEYKQALNQEGWSEHYNMDLLNSVVNSVESNSVSVWSEELAKILYCTAILKALTTTIWQI